MLPQAGEARFMNYWKNQEVGHRIVSTAKGIPFA